jgi:hypothetical protein
MPLGLVNGLRQWRSRVREPSLTALLVLQALLIFVVFPLRASGLLHERLVIATATVLFLPSLFVVSRSRFAIAMICISVALDITGIVLDQQNPSEFNAIISIVGNIVMMMVLCWVIGSAVFSPGRVSHHRIQGAIVLYLNIALLFAAFYHCIVLLVPDALTDLPTTTDRAVLNARLLYFSLSTLTTTGYGDVVPTYPLAQGIANLESVIGTLYPAILIARLVNLHMDGRE